MSLPPRVSSLYQSQYCCFFVVFFFFSFVLLCVRAVSLLSRTLAPYERIMLSFSAVFRTFSIQHSLKHSCSFYVWICDVSLFSLSLFLFWFVCLVLSLVWCFFILLISFIEIHLLNFTVLAHTKEIKKRSSFVCVFFVFAWILVLFILFYFFGWCKRFFRYHLGNQNSSPIQFSN